MTVPDSARSEVAGMGNIERAEREMRQSDALVARPDCLRCCGTGLYAPEVVCDLCFVPASQLEGAVKALREIRARTDQPEPDADMWEDVVLIVDRALAALRGQCDTGIDTDAH